MHRLFIGLLALMVVVLVVVLYSPRGLIKSLLPKSKSGFDFNLIVDIPGKHFVQIQSPSFSNELYSMYPKGGVISVTVTPMTVNPVVHATTVQDRVGKYSYSYTFSPNGYVLDVSVDPGYQDSVQLNRMLPRLIRSIASLQYQYGLSTGDEKDKTIAANQMSVLTSIINENSPKTYTIVQ